MASRFSSFIDLAEVYKEQTKTPEFAAAFGETTDLAIYDPRDEGTTAEMPDPEQAQAACAMVMATMFDLLRDTRLETFSDRLAWGFVHAFHKVAQQLETDEDRGCRDVREKMRELDYSEVASSELEKATTLARSLTEARGAMEAMRDFAADIYHIETGRPWQPARGSKVSVATTAARIESSDFLRARAQARRDQLKPEGPAVIFSGGQAWEDYALLYETLDEIKARIPTMVLHTTAQRKGCDAIAAAWAARAGVPIIAWIPSMKYGRRAPFMRNDQMLRLQPVEAIVCEGSGIQASFATKIREARVPLHVFRLRDQRKSAAAARKEVSFA